VLPAALALALLAAQPAPLEVLEAGEVQLDVATDRGLATGGVVLRRGAVLVRAASASYDRRTGEVEAWGGVLLTEPGRALAASRLHARLDGGYEARDVVAFLKDAPLDLSRCRTVDDARAAGRTRATLGGAVLSGDAEERPPRLRVERARVTLCDCGGGAPSWEIRASRADVRPGSGVLLVWPVVYVTPRLLGVNRPVPVLPLPALYLPLAERQTGLLFPELTFGGPAGFGLAQPVFVTLGRSWDATVTPGFTLGPGEDVVAAGGRAVRGPSLGLELRWAPAEGTRGVARLALLHHARDLWPAGYDRPPGLNRLALALVHDARLSDRTWLRADVGLVGDPLYVVDFSADPLLRAADLRRSALALSHRREDLLLAADAAYHLPVRPDFLGSADPARPAPFGLFGADLPTFHRLPSLTAALLPVRAAGPLRLAGFAQLTRFAPLRGLTGDEGLDGVGPGERGWPRAFDAGEGDGRWQRGERLAATRAVTRAELRAPFTVGGALELEAWAAATGAAYAFDDGGALAQARGVTGLELAAPLARSFGAGGRGLRHVIEPRLAWRAGTDALGPALPAYAYDELDAAPRAGPALPADGGAPVRTLSATPGRFHQLQLSVRNRLVAPPGAPWGADLGLGQDLDLAAGKAEESWGRLALRGGPATFSAVARFRLFGGAAPAPADARSRLDAFTELAAGLRVADARGDDLHASLNALGRGASPRLVGGLEPLFDARSAASFVPAASGVVGATARFSGGTLVYDAAFTARPTLVCPGAGVAGPRVFYHSASLVWDSPCRCFRAGVTASVNVCDPSPRFGVLLDLSSVGGGGLRAGG
jgi:LPS-assembly protein